MSVLNVKNDSKKVYPSCAVLLAAYNGEKWIGEQLETILKQIGVDVSIYISVDWSTDGTYKLCEKWCVQDARVKLLSYGERFGGAGKNFYRLIRDVDTAGFDMVAFADQDDLWLDDKLLSAWEKISTGVCQIYSSDVIAFWEGGHRAIIKKSYPQVTYDYLFEAAGPGCTYVFSESAFVMAKDFIVKNYVKCCDITFHDWLIYAYFRYHKVNWYIDDRPKMLYRQHESNQVGANNNFTAYIKRLNSVRVHWYRNQIISIAQLVTDFPVEKLTSRSFLLNNIGKLRRRQRDRVALAVMVALGIF